MHLTFKAQDSAEFCEQNKHNLTNGSSMSTMKMMMTDKKVLQEDGYVLRK